MQTCRLTSGNPGATLFASSAGARARSLPSFLASALLHCALILVGPDLGRFLANLTQSDQDTERRLVVVETLRLRVSERLYLPVSRQLEPVPHRQASPSLAKKDPASAQAKSTEGFRPSLSTAAKPRALPRRFELPKVLPAVDGEQTIIVAPPPAGSLMVEQTRLPALQVLAAVQPRLPRAPSRRFQLSASPIESRDVQLINPPQSPIAARLTLPVAAAVKGAMVSGLPSPPAPELPRSPDLTPASPEINLGSLPSPVSILLANNNPAPPAEVINVPKLSQARLKNQGSQDGIVGGGSGGNGSKDIAAGSETPGNGGLGGGGQLTDGAAGPEGSRPNGGDASGDTGKEGGNGRGPQSALGSSYAGIGLPRPPESEVRAAVIPTMIHPENGVFDVVIVESWPFQDVPEAAGKLSGRPVYMVYLNVGLSSEWILQYCVPGNSVRMTGNVVYLGNPVPVKAPYPRKTTLPPLNMLPSTRRAILHGYLDETGRFKNLKAIGGEVKSTGAILPFLAAWEFRPATRDGKPIEVEVLLGIPPFRQ